MEIVEFIKYTAVTILIWAISSTWLLPLLILLKLSKTFRDKFFSFLYVKILGPIFGTEVGDMRKKAFDLLKEHLEGRNEKIPLEILEIGIGEGANLEYYPENSNLTAVDMNESFMGYFKENSKKYPQVTYKRSVVAMAEDMHELDDDTFDVVVCTMVLCSVTNVRSVLKECKRVLKPGGKFLFIEHVIHPGVCWQSILQRLTNPLWNIFLDGCNLNRSNDEEIRRAGFSDVVMKKNYSKEFFMYLRPQITGIATK